MDIKQLFYRASENPFLIEMSDRLYSLTFRLWYFNMKTMDNQGWKEEVTSVKEDLVDLEALLDADAPAPTQTVGDVRKAHLLKHLKRIRSQFLGLSGL